ncbi:MAG: D-glucuronyl C5-epimerase family protein [Bacteroidales bacterium]|nr:D-glucuronyl C5-epimerase family protein [Bacteroidales bacterium]
MLNKFIVDLKSNKHINLGDTSGDVLKKYYFNFKLDPNKLNALIADFDENGVPLNTTYIDVEEKTLHYYPISIGQYALAVYHNYLDTKDEEKKALFLRIADWFYENRTEDEKLGVYWLTDVPKPEYGVTEAWKSGFSQSRGLSLLLRAWQLTGESKYLEVAKKALIPFTYDISDGGVAVDIMNDSAIYEEYVAAKPTRVLDGHNFCLFGIYDAVRAITPEVDEEAHYLAKRIYEKGINGLVKRLPNYDMGFWMRFNICDLDFYPKNDPCTIGYLRLVRAQLIIFNRITKHPILQAYIKKMKRYDSFVNIVRMYKVKFKALRQMNRL